MKARPNNNHFFDVKATDRSAIIFEASITPFALHFNEVYRPSIISVKSENQPYGRFGKFLPTGGKVLFSLKIGSRRY